MVEIQYWNKESWSNYVANDLLPLYRSCLCVLKLWERLEELCNGKLLSDIIKARPVLEDAFTGGTSPPDTYEERGLATLYRSLLGAAVKLREYYFLKAHGKELKAICTVSKTGLVRYLEDIATLLERILRHSSELGLVGKDDVEEAHKNAKSISEEIVSKPESMPEKLVDFLNKAVRITIAYNEHTRFAWHLRKIPKKYIKQFYPQLLKPESFKFIQEFLGLREFIVPQVEDPEIMDEYTVLSFDHAVKMDLQMVDDVFFGWGSHYLTGFLISSPNSYPYITAGGCLCRLNEVIWGLFEGRERTNLGKVITDELPLPLGDWKKLAGNKKPPVYSSTLDFPDDYEKLSILDELFPAIYTGELELGYGTTGKQLYVNHRW